LKHRLNPDRTNPDRRYLFATATSATFAPLVSLPLGPRLPELQVPPLLPILEHCERARFPEVMVSTPCPLGLAGLLAGKILGLRLAAVYPHGLRRTIAAAAGSDAGVAAAEVYLRWFYRQMDEVAAADPAGRDRLIALGLDPKRVVITPAEPASVEALLELESVA